jgi:hypothetical protein
LKEKCFLLFKKDLHQNGEGKENQKRMNKQWIKTQTNYFNGNKNNEQTKLVFSIAREK